MAILDRFRLDGKTALVTGCRRGIGKAIAVALAEAGADIAGVSKSLEPGKSEVEQEVRSRKKVFKGYSCDFADRAALYNFIRGLHSDFPRIDILVNNAGSILRKPAADYPDEYWDQLIEVNLNAQFILARELGKLMIERGSGKIIFIASLL
ncbi:MAG TPA: SDR family NAD(P)-dependent oxidoreductase, partial [Terriglobia bacterium]|nr:SDR family NAD(P)-dependent oxidoreductase [Terriglobia bacterium]